jgi:membrane-associated protease RseP (regulator of RpoE activity)
LDYLTLALVIFAVYWLFVIFLNSRGTLERYGISAYGPLLMLRTIRGLRLLDKLANPKKFWRVFADIGIPLTVFGMFFMLAILLIGDFRLLVTQPAPSALNAPQNVLLIPGVNQFIPLTWGLIGLIVTLVVHELSHGILSRVADIKVKSLGLLIALVPIGAFAEPDESQLLGTDAKPGDKIRGCINSIFVVLWACSILYHVSRWIRYCRRRVGVSCGKSRFTAGNGS